jgi:hypothetical protein
VKSLGDLKGNNTEFKDSLGQVVPSVSVDLGESEFNLLVHKLTTLVAGSDFLEVILSGHTIEEASEEFRNSSSWDRWD